MVPGKKESDKKKKNWGMLKGHKNQSKEAPIAKTGWILETKYLIIALDYSS